MPFLPPNQQRQVYSKLSIHTVTPAKSDGNSDENDRLVTLITPSVSSVVAKFLFTGALEFERRMCDSQGAKGAEASAPRLCGAGNGCPLPIGAGVSGNFFLELKV